MKIQYNVLVCGGGGGARKRERSVSYSGAQPQVEGGLGQELPTSVCNRPPESSLLSLMSSSQGWPAGPSAISWTALQIPYGIGLRAARMPSKTHSTCSNQHAPTNLTSRLGLHIFVNFVGCISLYCDFLHVSEDYMTHAPCPGTFGLQGIRQVPSAYHSVK